MRFGLVSLATCALLFVSTASAQTPKYRASDPVIGAAGLVVTNVSPGSLFSIYGSDLASTVAQADSTTLSTSMLDVDSVTFKGITFNTIKAPIRFVSPAQINAQVPWSVPPGTAEVVVTRNGVPSAPYVATIAKYSPAVYTFTPDQQAIAYDALDYSITSPSPNFGPFAAHPASGGDIISFYASGLGTTDNPPPADGVNSNDGITRKTAVPLTVTIAGVSAKVDFAGLSPQFTGVYQVNVVIPSGLAPSTAAPVLLAIGGVPSFSADPTKVPTIAVR